MPKLTKFAEQVAFAEKMELVKQFRFRLFLCAIVCALVFFLSPPSLGTPFVFLQAFLFIYFYRKTAVVVEA